MTETALSVNGIPIRLTDERWSHIITQHGELSDSRADVLAAIANPERILAGQGGELIAVRPMAVGKWLVVVYGEGNDDGFIITAFLTRRRRWLEDRIVVWSRSKNI